jgi:hypothetical protein
VASYNLVLANPDSCGNAFCGRVPKSVLARHYADFSPEKLHETYQQANLVIYPTLC